MGCELCEAVNESYRLVKETKYSFCIICGEPLKLGHVMVLPKRHVTQNNFSQLKPEEAQDLFLLLEQMQKQLKKLGEEDIIIFKNSGRGSSQEHLHFHLLPSKGTLRKLIGTYENIPQRKKIPLKKLEEQKEKILSQNE